MQEILRYLNQNSGAFSVLFALLVAVATVIYAILTWRLVRETQQMRRAQTDPSVAVRVEPSDAGINFMLLVVENVGPGPAYDVVLSVAPDFKLDFGGSLSEIGLFTNGISYLAPKQRIPIFLASIAGKAAEITTVRGPFDFVISVSYRNSLREQQQQRFPIDFRHFVGISTIGTPPLHAMAKDIEKLRKAVEHLQSGWKRIQIDTFTSADRANEQAEREQLRAHRRSPTEP